MHVHDLNPWRTLIALSVFIVILIVGFLTMQKPVITFEKDMSESINDLQNDEALFYPWELEGVISKEVQDIVLFDIRDNFVYGQGNMPGSENISANDLTLTENIKRLEELKEKNITVVFYGEDQLQANGAWMLFRQVGFDNVKILVGGYNYYLENKDDLYSTVDDDSYIKENPKYDFAEIAEQMGGTATESQSGNKKPVVVQRRQKTNVAAGGC